jgi:hypothetical protein
VITTTTDPTAESVATRREMLTELTRDYRLGALTAAEAMIKARDSGPVIVVARRAGALSYKDNEWSLEEFG